MELDYLINLISELPVNQEMKYVRGESVCTYVKINPSEPRVYAKTSAGEEKSWAPSFLQDLAEKIKENAPFNISGLLNNKGSFRPIIETILAHTREFYWVKYNNQIMIVWRPGIAHEPGELVECDITEVLDPTSNDVLLVNDITSHDLSVDQLVDILKSMYSKQKVAGIHMFGIKYGKQLENITATDIIAKSGLSDSYFVELNKGKALYRAILNNDFGVRFYKPNEHVVENHKINEASELQQIFYGAPGTGKSREIKKLTKDELVFRTTFHPDTDYASFVGTYKPVMKEVDMKVVPVVLNNGASFNQNEGSFKEKRISYEFVMQPFMQAYIAAWKEQADEQPQPVFLVIEEINRGNCAQIFGDIFQLLDRDDEGFSEYPIRTDEDLRNKLSEEFLGLDIDNEDVKSGKVLLLPNNLYIWATMNTSDQSLFPIDSAFKRRWDWKYVPISDAHKDWAIEVGENCYDWWEFLEAINQHIFESTNSEDKKLGYFFCKADSEGYISVEKFVSKVLFYLWNDVFKDYGLEGTLFDDAEGGKLSFDKFYTVSEGSIDVDIEKVETFLQNLGIEPIVWDDDYGTVGLRVEWPDGTVIDKPSKKEIYLEALRRIGIERAAEGLSDRYRMEDVPIISKRKNPKVESSKQYNYEKIDNYYVMVGIDNYGSALRQLSDKYNLGLTIVGE
jgi:hypothetical protein